MTDKKGTVHIVKYAHDLGEQNKRFRLVIERQASDLKQANKKLDELWEYLKTLQIVLNLARGKGNGRQATYNKPTTPDILS